MVEDALTGFQKAIVDAVKPLPGATGTVSLQTYPGCHLNLIQMGLLLGYWQFCRENWSARWMGRMTSRRS